MDILEDKYNKLLKVHRNFIKSEGISPQILRPEVVYFSFNSQFQLKQALEWYKDREEPPLLIQTKISGHSVFIIKTSVRRTFQYIILTHKKHGFKEGIEYTYLSSGTSLGFANSNTRKELQDKKLVFRESTRSFGKKSLPIYKHLFKDIHIQISNEAFINSVAKHCVAKW